MANFSKIVNQLKKERDRVEKQLSGLNAAPAAFVGVSGGPPTRKRRKMSVGGRKEDCSRTESTLGEKGFN